MQAAATRAPAVKGHRRTDNLGANPHLVTADDTGLLDALPIAAAIIERSDPKTLQGPGSQQPLPRHGRAIQLHRARLERGRLPQDRPDRRSAAQFLRRAGRHGRARLPRRRGRFGPLLPPQARALAEEPRLRTAMPAERRRPHRRGSGRTHAPRRDAARQPDRLAQPPGIQRGHREGRRDGRPRPRACGAGGRHAALQPDQRIDGEPGRGRAADHLRPAADPRAARRRRACSHGRQ